MTRKQTSVEEKQKDKIKNFAKKIPQIKRKKKNRNRKIRKQRKKFLRKKVVMKIIFEICNNQIY